MTPSAHRQPTVATCSAREISSERPTPNRTGIERSPCARSNVDVLAGVEHVEAADPGADGESQPERRPRESAAGGEPAADRRHRHRQAEEELRVAGDALGQRVPEHDRQRHRRQREADPAERPRRGDERHRGHDEEGPRLRRRQLAGRNLAVGGARVQRVPARVDDAVEGHRRAARRDHRQHDPAARGSARPGARRRPAARRPARTGARKPSG